MLVSDKPKRTVSQAPLKETTCHAGCGATVKFRTTPRVFCPACKDDPDRIRARTQHDTQLRKARRGSRYSFTCVVCGKDGTSSHPQTKSCKGCTTAARSAYQRERLGSAAIGAEFDCRYCGTRFAKVHKRQFYCLPCSALSASNKLPKSIEWNRKYMAAYGKRRRAIDPAFAIKCRMTANINNSLREGKGGRSWERLLGYSLADLMAHLERQFLPGMNWGNRSGWHIDHIRPVSSFNFQTVEDPEFFECWALTNLQPLWAVDNLKKGGRWAA